MDAASPSVSTHRQRRWVPIAFARLLSRARDTRQNWGSTPEDRAEWFPCGRYVPKPYDSCFRAVEIEAPEEIVWRWLCQMRVAPYSYDWLDNWGRQSPRELTPGVDQLAIGQRFVTVFQLVEFEWQKHLTLHICSARWFFDDVATTYRLVPVVPGRCRLVVNVTAYYQPGVIGSLRRSTFPWGELFMARKQLLTFKLLAEKQAHGDG